MQLLTYRTTDNNPSNTRDNDGQLRQYKILPPSNTDRRCFACTDVGKFYKVCQLPGGMQYCGDCLERMIKSQIDGLSIPMSGGMPILLKDIRLYISEPTARLFIHINQTYAQRRLEYETPNRTYCCIPTCSAWIQPKDIMDQKATCQTCHTVTCATCKNADHEGPCENGVDPVEATLLELAGKKHWTRCPTCSAMTDVDGCHYVRYCLYLIFFHQSSH